MRNPALHEQPRTQPAAVIPVRRNSSILDWLEATGRLLSRESGEVNLLEEEEEINELMAGDDNSFDLDDDDDDSLELDE